MHSQSSDFSSVVNLVDGSDGRGSSVSGNSGSSGVSSDSNWGSSVDVVRVSHDGGSNGLLDDGLSLDGNWDGDVVWGVNVDWGGDLDDLLGKERSVIGGIVWLVDKDGLLDVVDLSLGLDDGGVDGLGSLEDGWDSDGEMGGGGLVDLGGVSGDVAGLAVVNLLGDNGSGLVNGGDTGALGMGGVRSRGSGFSISDWGVGDNWAGRVVLGSVGNWSSGSHSGSGSNCGSSCYSNSGGSGSIAKTVDSGESKTSVANTGNGYISWGAESASHDKGKCHKRSHVARYLPLSC